VAGDPGERICIVGDCLSVLRYSGVGSRLNEEYCPVAASFLLSVESLELSPNLLSFSFASLFPIKSGCGGAGRCGTGFRPAMLRGIWGRAGGSCLLGGLAVDPLLLSNFNSEKDILLSLLTERRFQISGRGGDEYMLAPGLPKMFFGVCGIFCFLWSFLEGRGCGVVRASESTPLSESFVLLLSEKLRDSPGESE